MADALGKSRSHIANLLRLLSLPDSVQSMLRAGDLSAGHARALVTVEDPHKLAREVVRKGLSVRETEKLAKTAGQPKPSVRADTPKKDADTVALEQELSAALGMKVRIDHKPGQAAGRLHVAYETLEGLDRLCGLLTSGANMRD